MSNHPRQQNAVAAGLFFILTTAPPFMHDPFQTL
jgi:hypothetical protein